jgi:hypothetical protein
MNKPKKKIRNYDWLYYATAALVLGIVAAAVRKVV